MRTRLVEQQINLCLPGKIIHLAKAKKGMFKYMLLLCSSGLTTTFCGVNS